MKLKNILIISCCILFFGCVQRQSEQTEKQITANENFLKNLQILCRKELSGELLEYPHTTSYTLNFRFENCTENEIRIHTIFPDQSLYTIVFTLVGEELLLKHDVRNPDLSPANNTMFGGFASELHNDCMIFPVHNFGQDMWPDYKSFSWQVCFDKKGKVLEYHELSDENPLRQIIIPIP